MLNVGTLPNTVHNATLPRKKVYKILFMTTLKSLWKNLLKILKMLLVNTVRAIARQTPKGHRRLKREKWALHFVELELLYISVTARMRS